ncbi:hypothetical protein HQ571_01530 [Candidatus Kuenenbacteria bacterium]|nr:hypothetical protein [Candidatus Kuenenbacteria bacterium]
MGRTVNLLTFKELSDYTYFMVVNVGPKKITVSRSVLKKYGDSRVLHGSDGLPSPFDKDTVVIELGP